MEGEGPTRREFLTGLRDAAIAAVAVEVVVLRPALATGESPDATTRPGPDDAAVLEAVSRRVIPLHGIDTAPHDAVVAALAAAAARDAGTREVLAAGCAELRRHFGEAWRETPDAALDDYLRAAEATPFFRTFTGIAIPAFVTHPAVWAAVGYEGESASKGGYLHRGFDSLDWLPALPQRDTDRAP